MPVDKEKVRKALDSFENDDFVGAKEILQKEINTAKEKHLEKKLGLDNPITPAPEPDKDKDKE